VHPFLSHGRLSVCTFLHPASDFLHPGANAGSTRTEPKNAKIAVGEGRRRTARVPAGAGAASTVSDTREAGMESAKKV